MNEYMDPETLSAWAQSHETDIDITEAIAYLAQGQPYRMQRIWQDPSEGEVLAIWERATQNGRKDATVMDWGVETLDTIVESMLPE